MSRILRRPMFRGGPVDSRGTGITANLGYNNGGRVGFDNGGSPFLRTPISMSGGQIVESQKSKPYLDINKYNYSAGLPFAYERATPLKNIELTDTFVEKEETPTGDVLSKITDYLEVDESSPFEGYENFEDLPNTTKNITSRTDFNRYKKEQADIQESIQSDINTEGYLPTPGPEKGSVPKIDTSLLSNDSILNKQNTANEELTLEEVKESLGYKKAFRRDLGDMFGRGAASFIGAESLTEGAKKFFEAEAAAGPGRGEKIETAAGTFMLKDKAERSRDKAKVALMRADTDYKIAAGKKKDIAESVLSVVKQGLPTDAKLASAIQDATSGNTGNKYKFRGVVMFKDLNSILSSGKLKQGDTLIVKQIVKDPTTNTEKTKKKIIEITETGFEEIFNI